MIIIVLAVGLVLLNKPHSRESENSTPAPVSYQEKVMSVEEMGKADPAKFLKVTGTYNPNFWGDAFKVHGTVTNNATVTNYKDLVVEVITLSATNTELDRKQYKVYDYFPAHSTKKFELKISKNSVCKKISLRTISATPY